MRTVHARPLSSVAVWTEWRLHEDLYLRDAKLYQNPSAIYLLREDPVPITPIR